MLVRSFRSVGFAAFPMRVVVQYVRELAGVRSRERKFSLRNANIQRSRVADKHQHKGEDKSYVPEERHEGGDISGIFSKIR